MTLGPRTYSQRPDGTREACDCTVRAVAESARVPYAKAHALLAELGRKPRRGFSFREPKIKALGYEMLPEFSCMSLRTLANTLPATGAFVVRIRHHVFAVVDGVWKDDFLRPARTQVRMVYKAPASI
jgi:hypothetical protein